MVRPFLARAHLALGNLKLGLAQCRPVGAILPASDSLSQIHNCRWTGVLYREIRNGRTFIKVDGRRTRSSNMDTKEAGRRGGIAQKKLSKNRRKRIRARRCYSSV